VSFEDPWETRSTPDVVDRQGPGRHAMRGTDGYPAQPNGPMRPKRSWGFGVVTVIVAIAAVAVFAIGSMVADSRSNRVIAKILTTAPAGVAPTTVAAQPQTQPESHETAGGGQGMSGQIVGGSGLCLAGGSGVATSPGPVILATCTGTEDQQEWTLLTNGEIVLNGRCLGVDPASATSGSAVGLYGCTGTKAQLWTARNDRIESVGSGFCLGGGETDGAQASVAACQASANAQTWTVPSEAVDPSGLAMPVGNIPGWHQDFTDDFTENVPVGDFPAAVSSKWGDYLDGWPDTTHHGTYEPTKVVSIQNGVMNMYLHTENGVHMVAAPYPILPGATGSGGGTVYGIYEVRFKAQQVTGYKTAWLLWPDSENEDQGEIDFPEGNLQQEILAFMHHVGSDPQKQQDAYHTGVSYAGWHTATTMWTANSVIFLLDGKVVGDSTDKAVIPHTPMHWVLQTETRTGGGPPSDSATANVEIDWVSVWLADKS
jgi:Ricin-type beta-trefoil lectin domain/Glycosyl hydrolases family 16